LTDHLEYLIQVVMANFADGNGEFKLFANSDGEFGLKWNGRFLLIPHPNLKKNAPIGGWIPETKHALTKDHVVMVDELLLSQ